MRKVIVAFSVASIGFGVVSFAATDVVSAPPEPPPPLEAWQVPPVFPPLPPFASEARVEHDGAEIWYATYAGTGSPVILLHGAFGSADNFAFQVPALIEAGHRVIVIDSRGQGRSTRDDRPYTYELMESDVIAVMDALALDKAAIVGWSDGGIIGLIMAMKHPERVTRVFAYGANMDPSGLQPGIDTLPIFGAYMELAGAAYARLSPTPDRFPALIAAITMMLNTEPNYTAADLAAIKGPRIAIADGAREELIKPEHTEYLAHAIPGAELIILPDVSHFGLAQNPELFNAAMLKFLEKP